MKFGIHHLHVEHLQVWAQKVGWLRVWPPFRFLEKEAKSLKNLLLIKLQTDWHEIWHTPSTCDALSSLSPKSWLVTWFGRHFDFSKKRLNISKSSSHEVADRLMWKFAYTIYMWSTLKFEPEKWLIMWFGPHFDISKKRLNRLTTYFFIKF